MLLQFYLCHHRTNLPSQSAFCLLSTLLSNKSKATSSWTRSREMRNREIVPIGRNDNIDIDISVRGNNREFILTFCGVAKKLNLFNFLANISRDLLNFVVLCVYFGAHFAEKCG